MHTRCQLPSLLLHAHYAYCCRCTPTLQSSMIQYTLVCAIFLLTLTGTLIPHDERMCQGESYACLCSSSSISSHLSLRQIPLSLMAPLRPIEPHATYSPFVVTKAIARRYSADTSWACLVLAIKVSAFLGVPTEGGSFCGQGHYH